MKNRNFIKTSIVSLLPIAMAVGALFGVYKKPITEANAYSASSLPKTIKLEDCSESTVRSYYSNLINLSDSDKKGSNLLKNLKPILMNNQKYYSYDSGEAVWKMYEIIDRDWDKSPASAINGDYGTYDATTKTITGYEYGSNSNPKSNPYVHALYTNRTADNPKRAWGSHGVRSDPATIEREHIWPKSHGFKDGSEAGARGDPMHLWAADGTANGLHSNLFYGYVNKSATYTDAGDKHNILWGNLTGTSKTVGSGTVFEPQDSDKGDIARACFYMVARYNNLAGNDNNINGANPNLTLSNSLSENDRSGTSTSTDAYSLGILSDLLEWNRLDPPDEFEIHRNNLLYTNYTNNRNPFIDFPEWADIAFGNSTKSANPTSDAVSTIGGETKTVTSISVNTNPTKTTYDEGDTFDSTGLKLNVTYSDNSSTVISGGFTCSPNRELTTSDTSITISYGGKTTTVSITVNSTGGGGSETTEKTIDLDMTVFNGQGTSGTGSSGSYNFSGFVVSSDLLYGTSSHLRVYKDGKLTISSSKNIKSISFTYDGEDKYKGFGTSEITVNNKTWTGTATSQARIKKITVVYEEEGAALPTSLSLSDSSIELEIGESASLNATVLPSNASNKSVTWSSSDSSVVSVSSNGSLKALKAGSATITCTSAAVSTVKATCSVTVLNELELHNITIAGPTKTTYNQGEELDLSGLTVTAHYYRGQTEVSTENVTDEAEVSGYNPSTIGNQTITVSFGGKNETFTVTVNEVIEENTIIFNYQNQGYTNGQAVNSLTVDNFKVSFVKNNGAQPAYYTSGNAVRIYKNNDIEVTGNYKIKKITIETSSADVELNPSCGTYSNGVWSGTPEDFVRLSKTTSDDFYITRIKVQYDPTQSVRAPLSSITLSGYKAQFYKGDAFSSEGLVVTAHYTDGSTQVVNPTSVSTPSMTYNGDKDVTVTYNERGVTVTEKYSINVKNDSVVSIALSGEYKTSFNVGDTFDYSGLVVAATWESGKTTYPNVTNECTINGYDMNSATEQTVTVTYSRVSNHYTITVKEKTVVYGEATYTFTNDKTSAQGITSTWTSADFMEHVVCNGDDIITGMSSPVYAYIGGNGGSGDTAWNVWNSLKIGKNGGQGSITLTLDNSISFASIKVKALGARNDGTLTINGITKNVTKQASKNDLTPMELEYEITGEISELNLSSYNSTKNNYSIVITSIEFVGQSQPTPEKTLTSIAVSGQKTSFNVNDEFSFGGTVTATYSDDSTEDVTASATFSGYDMSTAKNQVVTVTYSEKTATYSINVIAPTSKSYSLTGGKFFEGTYLIGSKVTDSTTNEYRFMKAEISSSRFAYETITVNNNKAVTSSELLEWEISKNGEYYTLYNRKTNQYAASTGAANKGALQTAIDDKALWSLEKVSESDTYNFINKANTASSVNAALKNNSTYGFATYSATGNYQDLSLFRLDNTSFVRATNPEQFTNGSKLTVIGLNSGNTFGIGSIKNNDVISSPQVDWNSNGIYGYQNNEAVTLEIVTVGEYFALKTADGKYLYSASSSVNAYLSNTLDESKVLFTTEVNEDGVSLKSVGNSRYLGFNYNSGNPRFGFYASASNSKNVNIYIDRSSGEANAWSANFLNGTNGCKITDWDNYKTSFGDISYSSQTAIKEAVANQGGSLVEQAAARYDYIVSDPRYDVEAFISDRAVAPANRNVITLINIKDNPTLLIVLFALAGLTTIGAYIYIKRRKEADI